MNIDLYILAFSAVTVLVTIWMGFRSAKKSKTASDFFVAGRSVSVGWNASAISGEYLSAASFMGIGGMVMSSGYDALWYPVCYACGYLFLLLFIAGPLRRFGAYTIPDFAEGRFDSPVFRKIAVVFVLFIGFFYTMPQMKGAGTTLAYIFDKVDLRGVFPDFLLAHDKTGAALIGLPYWAGVVLVGAVITLNVALGGMKGITLVQAFQYWAKMFAISVPIFVLMAVYGHYGKQVGDNGRPLSSAPKESFSSVSWKVTSINGDSNQWSLKFKEMKSAVARRLTKPPAAFGDLDAFTALRLFAENHGLDRLLIASSAPQLGQLTNKIYVMAASSLEDWERDVRAGFKTNGVGLIITPSALVLVPSARIADYEAQYERQGSAAFEPESRNRQPRQPLPPKAPADATWLNPFGPLTTKAAKNAAAAIGKKVAEAGYANIEFFEVTPSTLLRPPADASLRTKIVADIFPIKMTVMPTQPFRWPVSQLASNCAALTGDRYLIATNLAMANVEFGNTTPLNNSQYVAAVHAVLQTNETIWLVRDDGPMPTFATNRLTVLREGRTVHIFAAKNGAAAIGKKSQLSSTDLSDDWRQLSGSTSHVAVSTSMTLTAVNGWVTLEPPSRLDRAEDRLKAVFGQAQHYSVGNAKLVSVLMDYARLSGQTIIAHTNIGLTRLLGSLELDWNQRATLVSDVESFLRTNGVALRKDKSGAVRAMTSEHAAKWDEVGRTVPSALGQSAKSDAAVALGARRGEDTAPYQTVPLRADLSPDVHMTVNLDSPSVAQALAIYAELTDRQFLPNTNSVAERVDDFLGHKLSALKLVARSPAPDSGVRIHADGPFTAAEVKTTIEAHLRTNGLAAVAVGEKAFRLVAAEVSRLDSKTTGENDQSGLMSAATNAEKAWLARHEKPLALLYTYSLIIAIVCGTAGLPHILVRFYTNPDGTAAKKTTMWVMILIGVFYIFPPVFGVLGRNLLPDLYAATGAKGTDKIVLELPRILNAKYPPLGSILSGITCAGAFAAFMSTFSGLLVSMTGALAHDVYGRILRPKATADERMRMFKIGAVIIGVVAILLGMQVEQLQINFMVGQAFAIAAASYFPLLFMAVWWRKLTMKGAATGMLTGGLLALTGISLTSFSDLKWINLADFWAWHPLLRILCEQPAIWTVPLAITLMMIVSKLTARETPSDIRMKMLVLHAPEQLGLKQEYIQEHQAGH